MTNREFLGVHLRALIAISWLVAGCVASAPAWAESDPAIPMPEKFAKDLELFGDGVVGKALPAPAITDIREYLNQGKGTWEYQILKGGKAGQKVRSEKYEQLPDEDGKPVWKRTIGTEFVEYWRLGGDAGIGKYLEDDLELNYSSRFLPSIVWLAKMEPGVTQTLHHKIESFNTDKPDHVKYRGKLTAKLTYVGLYEITTPAGTWPAILVRSEFDIKIGPANVTDTTYSFYAKGIGKIAEIETTHVSALLIYHSSTRVAKVLTKYPKH